MIGIKWSTNVVLRAVLIPMRVIVVPIVVPSNVKVLAPVAATTAAGQIRLRRTTGNGRVGRMGED